MAPHALPSPSSPALLTLLLPVACEGTSQHDTDEGGIVGDDGAAGSRRDVTGRYNADDGAITSAESKNSKDDHTPYNQVGMQWAWTCKICPHTWVIHVMRKVGFSDSSV